MNKTKKLSKAMEKAMARANDLDARGWLLWCAPSMGSQRTVDALARRGLLIVVYPARNDFTTPVKYCLPAKSEVAK